MMSQDSTEIARGLAAQHPENMFPCPYCVTEVRGENLAKHFDKVHGSEARPSSHEWRGADKASVHHLLVAVLLFAVLGTIAVGLSPNTRVASSVFIAIYFPLLALFLISITGKLRATLTLDDSGLQVRTLLGLRKRRVPMSAAIELCTATKVVSTRLAGNTTTYGDMTSPSEERRFGQMLRFVEGGRSIGVGCKKGTGFRSHWAADGWTRGAKRRRWDITLDQRDVICLENQLVARGRLRPAVVAQAGAR